MTVLCSIDGCGNRRIARGWCRKHYNRWYWSQGGRFQAKAIASEKAIATHCRRGHKYTEADRSADGKRRCRSCAADRDAQRRHWEKTRPRDKLSVDESEYARRREQRLRKKTDGALTGPPRTNPWTPAEDVIVLRDDIFLVEKVAMLQRSSRAVLLRGTRLRRPVRPCAVCGKGFHARAEVSCCSQSCAAAYRRTIFPIFCIGCGQEFQPQTSTQKYCTKDCLVTAKAARFDVPCEHCSSVFRQRITGQRFCSQRCMGIARQTVPPKPCLHCGTEFRSRERSQVYCSNRCRIDAGIAGRPKLASLRCLRCGAPRPRRDRKYCSYSCAMEDQRRPPRPCQHCGKPFTQGKDRQRFCSRDCSVAAERAALPPTTICLHCGTKLKRNLSGAMQKAFCSQECNSAARTRRHPRPCQRCGEVFKPRNDGHKYCSRDCAGSARVARVCTHCGGNIPANTGNKKYCSQECCTASTVKRPLRPCAHCCTEFKPSNAASKYCSMQCSAASQVTVPTVKCLTCGVKYRPQRVKSPNKYCSRKCYGISIRKPATR